MMESAPMRRGRSFWILLLILLGLWALFLYKSAQTPPNGLREGDSAPAFTVYREDGTLLQSSELRGERVLVHFWATWCGPCKDEMPKLQAFVQRMAATDFIPLIVSEDLGKKDTDPFRARYGITIPFYYDLNMAAAEAFKSYGLPETFLIGRDGMIVKKWIGPANWSDERIEDEIKKL